ncbi:MAG: CHAP domain-containing protein [Oscillatoria princeps RMCB-10]|jgi:surface antigen|nr:CHAP domain-containing protein [Oscillatoria princeps RMCB-10]
MNTKRLIAAVAAGYKKQLLLAGSSVALAIGSLPVIPLTPSPSLAQSAGFCQCVGYVKNRFGLQGAVGNAKDMIYSLPNLGFRRISGPQQGAIAVMQPSFPGANRTYGHVGVVESIQPNGRISLRGANQLGNKFTEYGCNNVTVIGFLTSVNNRPDLSFWVRGTATMPPPGGINQVNFSGWVMSTTGVNLRNSPRLSDRSNQNVAYRQTLSFDGWTYGETVNDLQLGTPDARWYKLAGTNFWVPSAYIYGNAPNSRPMP